MELLLALILLVLGWKFLKGLVKVLVWLLALSVLALVLL
jgi:hypothetical protein